MHVTPTPFLRRYKKGDGSCYAIRVALLLHAVVKSNHVMQIGIMYFNWNVIIINNGLDNARLYAFYLGSYLVVIKS